MGSITCSCGCYMCETWEKCEPLATVLSGGKMALDLGASKDYQRPSVELRLKESGKRKTEENG